MINDDFCTHDFGSEKFDLVFSAATIQWIPENIAFFRSFDLLKSGGALIMIANIGDSRARNSSDLLAEKDRIYRSFFKPETPYTLYIYKTAVVNYGFEPIMVSDFTYLSRQQRLL